MVVNYRDPITVPEFPMPVLDEDRSSPRNQELLKQAEGIVESLKSERAGLYKRQAAELEQFGGKVLDTYWLVQGVHASLPVESVRKLADSDEIEYLELADGAAKPPADANPANDMDDARAQIFSDPYFNLGQTSGWIGLLDTGVRTTARAVQLARITSRSRSDLTGDGDPSDQCGHGTSSAAEITGNARLGNAYRGVSAIAVDSWDIYGNDCLVGSAHTVSGFQQAVLWLDKVIVAEIQLNAGEASASSTAADNAFNARLGRDRRQRQLRPRRRHGPLARQRAQGDRHRRRRPPDRRADGLLRARPVDRWPLQAGPRLPDQHRDRQLGLRHRPGRRSPAPARRPRSPAAPRHCCATGCAGASARSTPATSTAT